MASVDVAEPSRRFAHRAPWVRPSGVEGIRLFNERGLLIAGQTDRTSTPPPREAAPGTLAATGEFAVIDAITAGRTQLPQALIGPGDDAALLAVRSGELLASVDVLVDGVHFRTDWANGEQIGRRAALASMADIVAMGGLPTALLVGLSAPGSTALQLVRQLGEGIHQAAAEVDAAVIGGDLTSSTVLTISITVLGEAPGPVVRRDGAQVGDLVAVCGRLGWAAAGLAVLSRGFRSPAAVVSAYRSPEPPLAAGPAAAAAGATAMIDVSDGLVADLGHIAAASGVAIDVHSSKLAVPAKLTEVAGALGRSALAWVLSGGDDHALAATFPSSAQVPADWTVLGRVTEGSGVLVDGQPPEELEGWDHFRPSAGSRR